jgi:hypothetical protein
VPSKRMLTPDQIEWHERWMGGTLAVVEHPDAALRLIGAIN